jgi:adenine deaminase
MNKFTVTGQFVDVPNRRIFPASVTVNDGIIQEVRQTDPALIEEGYIIPGFVDAHVHIESSLLVPSEFARMAVVHGTVATVSDPHEIANVCGMKGVEFMIDNGNTVPFKFNFGAPSCVPATVFETSGDELNADDVEALLRRDEILYLSEMMNFPGVLNRDDQVMKKISAAHLLKKPVDGHAPGLKGDLAKRYIEAGISTDHECFTIEEALDKLNYGMKILIREGSAAKNFEALADLIRDYSDRVMFCSDDKHPDSLELGHINQLCARAVAKGIDVFNVLKVACYNPVEHYQLPVGLLREKDPADFIVVDNLKNFRVKKTIINGQSVSEDGKSLITAQTAIPINNFSCRAREVEEFAFSAGAGVSSIPVIEALDGQLITNRLMYEIQRQVGKIESNVKDDILKLVVVNRYSDSPIAISFVHNFGLKKGAIASSVAHDSHNIVAVGADDESLCKAVNLVIKERGGLSAIMPNYEGEDNVLVLPLPVAGLMSNNDGWQVAQKYAAIDHMAKQEGGSTLAAPFMALSFMALLVIPHLKLSDRGLFDGDSFSFVTAD